MDLHLGDCVDVMAGLEPESVDSCVCDPPYGIAMMGAKWDRESPGVEWADAVLRVLKPGGHVLAFASTRTDHRIKAALELGGFELRDTLGWVQWQGMPKSLNVALAISKRRTEDEAPIRAVCRYLRAWMEARGLSSVDVADRFGCHSRFVDHWAARDTDSQPSLPTDDQWRALSALLELDGTLDARVEELNQRKGERGDAYKAAPVVKEFGDHRSGGFDGERFEVSEAVHREVSDEAAQWEGWGTGLAPCHEPIVLARKPVAGTINGRQAGTVAANVLEFGTGALNIDACRFAEGDPAWLGPDGPCAKFEPVPRRGHTYGNGLDGSRQVGKDTGQGRWPGNLYYHPKVSPSEREFGCDALPLRSAGELVGREEGSTGIQNGRAGAGRTAKGRRNHHVTLKPVELMRWLVRLVTPPGGLVLDPYTGSGSTAIACAFEGFRFVGAELDDEFHKLASVRIEAWRRALERWRIMHGDRPATVRGIIETQRPLKRADFGQQALDLGAA